MKIPITQTNTVCVCRTSRLVSVFTKRLPLVACFLMAISVKATLPSSDLPSLGSLGNFAIVGSQLNNNSATINGDVGIFSGGSLKLGSPNRATINGDILLSTNALIKASAFNGTVLNNQNLSLEQAEVISDSSLLGALTADSTITKIQTAALSFNVPTGEVEVVDIDKGLNLSSKDITLTGGGELVLNIEGKFNLSGSASIIGSPDNIYINYEGNSTMSSRARSTVDALVFDPNAAANLGGTWNGGFFGGKKAITLGSGAMLTEAPEPGPMVLVSVGLASLLLARRLKNHFKEKRTTKKT